MKNLNVIGAALMALMVSVCPQVRADDDDPLTLTGIYVEYYTEADLCPGSPSLGDGWAPVSGFPNRGAGCSGTTPANGLAYGSNISFTGNSGANYRIFAVDSSQSIGNITVGGSGFTLIVGRSSSTFPPFHNDGVALATAGGGSIGAISADGGRVQVRSTDSVASVSANIVARVDARNSTGLVSNPSPGGDIGTVRAPSVFGVQAQGDLDGVIIASWDTGSASAQDFVGTISSVSGNIGTVQSTAARIRGLISANQGAITAVTSGVGIGPATGTASVVRAQDGIVTISAPAINADIDAKYNSGSGVIQTLTTSTGNFAGSLQAAGIGSTGTGMSIAGNLTAPVTVSGNVQKPVTITGTSNSTVSMSGTISQPVSFNGGVTGGSVTLGTVTSTASVTGNLGVALAITDVSSTGSVSISGNVSSGTAVTVSGTMAGTMKIGGSLAGSLTTGSTGTPGLSGQVVINANDASGTWTGNVRVGGGSGTLLSPTPLYTNLPSALGGGYVGVVPFLIHDGASTPDNASTGSDRLLASQFNNAWNPAGVDVVLRGRVSTANPSTALKVKMHLRDCDNVVSSFDITSRLTITLLSDNRTFHITTPSNVDLPGNDTTSDLYYTVEPFSVSSGTARLFCSDLLVGGNHSVGNFLYTFYLRPDCNNDGTVDAGSCGNSGICDSIDFNGDGLYPDTQDIDDFLAVFSGGACPTGTCGDIDFNNDGLFPDTADSQALIDVFGGNCAVCLP